MKKYLSLVLLAIAFVILLVTLRSAAPTPTPTPVPISWTNFDNQFQQYRLKYPESWSSNNDKNHLIINKNNQVTIDISYLDLGNEPFNDWIKRQDTSRNFYFPRGLYVFVLSVTGNIEKYQPDISQIVDSFSLYSTNPVDFQPFAAYQNSDFGFEFGYPDFLKATYDTDRIIISQENPYNSSFDFLFFFWPVGGEYPKEKGYIYKDITSDGYVYRFAFDASAKDDYINQIVSTLKLNVH